MNNSILLLLLVACGPKPVPVATAPVPPPEYVPVQPVALAPRPFQPPVVTWGQLAAGTPVAVVENHEVPLVNLRIEFPVRATAGPKDKAGLAEATMDMLNEGAGSRDAAAISAELSRLGAGLSTGAGYDGSSVSISCLRDTLEPTLDLLADVLMRPTFPSGDWDLRRSLWIDDIKEARNTPNRIAERVVNQLLWGQGYRGIEASEATLARISIKDMKAWYKANLSLQGAIVLVGGDITVAEVVPMLETRLGQWKGKATKAEALPTPPTPPAKTTIYLVDKPGSAQSVVRAVSYAGKPTDPDYAAFTIGNMAVGGQFASRINLNLRESKGYTYGARTSVGYDLSGSSFSFSSGIHTEKTGLALVELFKELREVEAGRPLDDNEVSEARGALLGGWPLRFESPDYALGQIDVMRTYGLPDDWVTGYPARVGATTTAAAQKAFSDRVDPDRLLFVIVGDAAVVRPELEKLGLLVVPVSVDGVVLSGG